MTRYFVETIDGIKIIDHREALVDQELLVMSDPSNVALADKICAWLNENDNIKRQLDKNS